MRRTAAALFTVVLIAIGTSGHAQERIYSRSLTCSALKDLVARDRNVLLASSETAYEAVHRDSTSCASDETGTPAYAPASDEPSCFAGWRCKQRSNDTPK